MISDTIEALQHSLVPGFGSTRTQERQRRALELFARSHTFSETTNEHAEASAPASASASAGSLNCLIPITFRDVAYIQTSHGLSLANHGIVAISPAIAHAADILTRLDLSHNLLASLPSEIGCLVNLRAISLSHNRLRTFPDSIRQLTKLTEIHASYNELTSLPSCIGVLRSLVLLDLAHNQITDLPGSIRGLTSLINLRISFNPLRALPAEIAMLTQIRTIHAEGCPFHKTPELDEHGMEAVPVPSLRELAARTIINNRLDVSTALSPPLQRLLRSAQQCSVCGGPYIETCVRRYRMIVRDNPNPPQPTPLNANGNPDMSALQQSIPLEYRMCWNHWSSDGDRIVSMFQTKRRPASSTIDSIRHTASTTNHQQASRPSRLRSLGKSLSSIISGSHRGSKRRSESVDALVAAVSLTDAIAPYSAPTAPPLVSIDALTTEDAFDSVGVHSSANEVVEAATALILTMSPTIAPSAPFIMHEESLSSQSDDAIIQVPQITVQSTGNESTMSTLKPRQPHQQHRRHFSRNRRISFSAKDALQPASLPAISPPTVAPSTSISAPLDLTSLSSSTEQRWSALHDDSGLMVVESGVPLETIDSAVLMPSLDLQDITADGVESLDDALERVQLYPAVTISTSPIAL
ncbi:L domain-like protein [Ramicandelaber brevisporus]|nr:L domain-like protein [Ramicandelaber brevisporus]